MNENEKLKLLVKYELSLNSRAHLEVNPDSKFSQGNSIDSGINTQDYGRSRPGNFTGSNTQHGLQPKEPNSGQWRKKYGEKNR